MSGKQNFDQNNARNIAGGKTPTTTATPAKSEDKSKYEKVSPDTLNKLSGGQGGIPVGESQGVGKVTARPVSAAKVDAKTLGTLSGGKGETTSASAPKSTTDKFDSKSQKISADTLNKFSGGKGTSTGTAPAKSDGKGEKLSADTLNKLSGGKGDNPTLHKSGYDKSVTGATGKIPEKFEAKDLGKISGGFSANEQKVKTEVKPVANKQSPLTGGSSNLIK